MRTYKATIELFINAESKDEAETITREFLKDAQLLDGKDFTIKSVTISKPLKNEIPVKEDDINPLPVL